MAEIRCLSDSLADWRILIIDSSHASRENVKQLVESLGATDIVSVDSDSAALATLDKEAFDLLVCEWELPNTSGPQLLEEIRALPNIRPNIPCLMLSGDIKKEHLLSAIKAGVADVLRKPVTRHALEASLSMITTQVEQGNPHWAAGRGH